MRRAHASASIMASGFAPVDAARIRRSAGFTIIEILIVLSILGVLAAIGAPALRDALISSQVRSAASDLYGSVILARSEAIKRAASVDVVPVSSNWSSGWSVKFGSTVLESHEATTNVTITPNVSGDLTFRLDGRVSTSLRSLVLTASGSSIVPARCVVIDVSGRPSVKTDTDNDSSNGCN